MASLNHSERNRRKGDVKMLQNDIYCSGLLAKYGTDPAKMPAWVVAELFPFGSLAGFYLFCGKRWSDRGLTDVRYDFKRAKSIRNSTAHGTCLINSFSSSTKMSRSASQRILAEVSKTGVSKTTRKKHMGNPAVQEIATVLVLYAQILDGEPWAAKIASVSKTFGF